MKNSSFILKIVLLCIFIAIAVIAIAQNASPVAVRFLFLEISAPVIAVIIVSLFIGFLIGILTFSIIYGKNKKTNQNQPENSASSKK